MKERSDFISRVETWCSLSVRSLVSFDKRTHSVKCKHKRNIGSDKKKNKKKHMRIIKIAGRLPVSGHDKYGLVGTLITINDIYRSVLLILLDFCVLFLFFCLSLSCVLCTQCCQFLWIVHSWLLLRFSLSFISIVFNCFPYQFIAVKSEISMAS